MHHSRVVIIVKALPHHSVSYGETVCCAGITPEGKFKRLFPVRFRHLSGKSEFQRWDWVRYKYVLPKQDRRPESCKVIEESILKDGKMPVGERASFLEGLISPSIDAAATRGKSLALIRPTDTRFYYKPKSPNKIKSEQQKYELAVSQLSFFDKELMALEPSPYDFRFKFNDESGSHDFSCGDWETHAMFFKSRKREASEKKALEWISATYNEKYPSKGMLFAAGNIAARPRTWQLLGVLRVDNTGQGTLF